MDVTLRPAVALDDATTSRDAGVRGRRRGPARMSVRSPTPLPRSGSASSTCGRQPSRPDGGEPAVPRRGGGTAPRGVERGDVATALEDLADDLMVDLAEDASSL